MNMFVSAFLVSKRKHVDSRLVPGLNSLGTNIVSHFFVQETAAAIKVQSVYRRNKAMKELEEKGITTACIRNRARRRQARLSSNGIAGSADIPNLFACCGLGLAFGEATEEDYEASRQHAREQYIARKKEREEKEAELRKQYRKSAAKKFAERGTDVEECFEVVDDDDAEV
jgi:hypothetical protein